MPESLGCNLVQKDRLFGHGACALQTTDGQIDGWLLMDLLYYPLTPTVAIWVQL